MAQNLAELCTVLIENHIGELSAQLFATLAEHGRLTVHTLAEHAKIPLRRVRTGLADLMEEQLALHFAAEEDAPTYYSVNWRNAYNLARHTNIVDLVNDRHGELAGQMVGNILQLGHARTGDLAEAYDLMPASKRDSGVDAAADHMPENGLGNGIAKASSAKASHDMSTFEFHSTLRALLRSGVLVKVGMRAYMPPSDLQEQIEETVISDQFPDRKVTGPKKQHDFKVAINALKRKWREDDAYSDLHDAGSRGAIKRPGDHFKSENKRAKVNGGHANGLLNEGEQSTSKLSDDLVVRVDFSRCTMAMRSRRLEQHAKRFLGGVTAAVYGALLQTLEGKVRAVHDELAADMSDDDESSLPAATAAEVAEILDPAIELGASIKGLATDKTLTNGTGKKGKKPHDDFGDFGIKRELSDSEDEPTTNGYSGYRDRANRLSSIEAHLALLEEHTKRYCKRVRAHGSSEWRVDFPALTATLVEAEVDTTIQARYGKLALRVARMLRERGKLEEKQVASCAMMRIKDIRAILTELQFHGILEAQELPKDNGRQPSRTLYLWFCDTFRVQHLFLQQTYKAMARTLQRIPVERERYRTVIEKAERTDVKGREQEKLEQPEKQALREWREVEERLLSQVDRMDEMVALLRDFSGRDTSLTT
ncbi:hypothetical protein LTR36_006276 [Oleoguttula mirabilis]|uniref:DNA-directed RNA polymerase III subunit RPC3 n=1 Tax=Oleoguttula mirabilis TaxID=1507867 RepID=A0AAV9JCZ0_9PEZI|nr:hypothetical protein LTR36_006276 [Oleoguttula mirabilis]